MAIQYKKNANYKYSYFKAYTQTSKLKFKFTFLNAILCHPILVALLIDEAVATYTSEG